MSATTRRRRSEGKCGDCENPAEEGRARCQFHRELKNAAKRNERKRRRDEDKCFHCEFPAKPGHAHCDYHLERARNRQREHVKENKALGLCDVSGCKLKATDGFKCLLHAEKNRMYQRRYQEMRREAWKSHSILAARCFHCGGDVKKLEDDLHGDLL